MINLKDIKLIIWDLDDTFWRGTLSENTAEIIPENCRFIRALVDKGIMCSICSKNNYADVENFFAQLDKNVWWGGVEKSSKCAKIDNFMDFFIFSSINWEPKGARVQKIITDAQLRPVNVLFIDDNELNLNEVKYYNPDIKTCTPEEIESLISQLDTVDKDDSQHSRLKQYKILEKKLEDKSNGTSNVDFLRNSQIEIQLNAASVANIDRISEMIMRTNQLNFTKQRQNTDEIENLLQDPKIKSYIVRVRDKYGDYGECGFIALDVRKNRLVHFLFSCRILSMGVEQFLYRHFNSPEIDIVGETASSLTGAENVDWIKLGKASDTKRQKSVAKKKILFKGPCDLLSLQPYLQDIVEIDTEFNRPTDGPWIVAQQHTQCIVAAKKLSQDRIDEILRNVPVLSPGDFQTKMYDDEYDAVVFSLLIDDSLGLYKNKQTGFVFPFMTFPKPITKDFPSVGTCLQGCLFDQETLDAFVKNNRFVGHIRTEDLIDNLSYIYDNMCKTTNLILMLGSEKPTNVPFDEDQKRSESIRHFHIQMNRAIEKWAENKPRVVLINWTDFISSPADYTDYINHFQRSVYYKCAMRLNKELTDKNYSKIVRIYLYRTIVKNILTVDSRETRIVKDNVFYTKRQKVLTIFGIHIPLRTISITKRD